MFKTRGLVIVVALLLATTATVALFMYVRTVREDARTGGGLVEVVVSTKDIPSGTSFDSVPASQLQLRGVPRDDVVRDAVTSVSELRGRTTTEPIVAGEQISMARVREGTQVGGGTLGIPKGDVAMTLPLDASRVVDDVIGQGDHVTIYGTFDDQQSGTQAQPATTVVLVPDVQILRVTAPGASSNGSTSVSATATAAPSSNQTLVTLALSPKDAERVVFAQEQASVWLALLPPQQHGVSLPPVTERGLSK